jgi:protein-S-isoprenylcysteine O-methyltransferase Ste14
MKATYKKEFPFVPIGYLVATIIYFWLILASGMVTLDTRATAGIVITLAAYLPWILARYELGNSLTMSPEARTLVTTGIYSKIQHPMYLSQFFVILGLSLFLQSWTFAIIGLVGSSLLNIYRAREEYKILKANFGKAYEDYAAKTWF